MDAGPRGETVSGPLREHSRAATSPSQPPRLRVPHAVATRSSRLLISPSWPAHLVCPVLWSSSFPSPGTEASYRILCVCNCTLISYGLGSVLSGPADSHSLLCFALPYCSRNAVLSLSVYSPFSHRRVNSSKNETVSYPPLYP